ncbi:MAG: hypothetical protein EOP60_01070 [Sphingomonadales bacterium]|nr:MAG: hypothetical protein EOP60_01070 [Sphingomonadales bacterium]
MSFREKIAWAAFVTTLLTWGAYFTVVVTRSGSASGDATLFFLFIAAAAAQAVLLGAAAAVSALIAPSDARAAPDERDRVLAQRASAIAYGVVLVAIAGVIGWMHVGLRGTSVIFALIGVFILGEAVRFGTKAIGYRIGA